MSTQNNHTKIRKLEVSSEEFVGIPEEVLEIYKTYRPTPLVRAKRLEKFLDTPSHIYFNHVLLHQTVIGLETKKQMEMVGEYPDIIIGCCGGGSNFGGFAFPFVADKLSGKKRKTRFLGVEPQSCPSMTKGEYRYDFGDTAGMTPLLKMRTLGSDFIPSPIHAGGLRYHGIAPLIAFLQEEKFIEARAYGQKEVFKTAVDFAKAEGIIPAPESSHAIKAAIDEAIKCKKEGKKKVIVFNLSGHGLLDLSVYQDYLEGKLK